MPIRLTYPHAAPAGSRANEVVLAPPVPRVHLALAIVLATLALVVLTPRTMHGQQVVLSPYVAINRSMPDAPPLVGGTAGVNGRIFGARVGGALAMRRLPADTALRELHAWTADADLVLDARAIPELAGMLAALGGFAPIAFSGVGAQGVRDADGVMRTTPVWSWGGGVSRTLIGSLAFETEARYRAPARFDATQSSGSFVRGWEYRAGLSLRFGGERAASGRGSSIPLPRSGGATTVRAAQVLDTADDYLGTRYVYGGESPRGFDCSGFVQYVFAKHDVTLPRTSRQQARAGRSLPTSVGALRAGDLMLFASEGGRIDHVAIYAGRNRILHSTSSGGGVRYDDLGTDRGRWFVSKMVAARRVIDGGNSLVDALQSAELLEETFKSFDAPDRAPRP